MSLTFFFCGYVAKTIYENNIQQAPSCLYNRQSTDSIFQYLFESIIKAMEVYQFQPIEEIQALVTKVKENCKDKTIVTTVQSQLDLKAGKNTTEDDRLKQTIIEQYHANPSCITHILEMTKNVSLIYIYFNGAIFSSTIIIYRNFPRFWIHFLLF